LDLLDWISGWLEKLSWEQTADLSFQSVVFLGLFSCFFVVYVSLARFKHIKISLLLLFSLYFYFKISNWGIVWLCGLGLIDYSLAILIFKSNKNWIKNSLFFISVVCNLGLLLYFKYTGFFVETLVGWQLLVAQPDWANQIIAPIGISYYVFKSLSYVLDVYNEMIDEPEKNPLVYITYLSFFPTLLAGPITRARDFLPQLHTVYSLQPAVPGKVFFLFVRGLFKKLVFADFLTANYVNRMFDTPELYSGLEIWMAGYAYGLSLYYDFSGYTDMATAIGLLLGIDVGKNFNQPFKATSVSDFWRRWHISLSSWFNEYVHTPLSFSWRKAGKIGLSISILLTFILSGLWHGPSWLFVAWGGAHGLAIIFEIWLQPVRSLMHRRLGNFWTVLSVIITLHFLCITYFLFRAPDVTHLGIYYEKITTAFGWETLADWWIGYRPTILFLISGYFLIYLPDKFKDWLLQRFVCIHWSLQAVVCCLAILLLIQLKGSVSQPFIYLQF
jgi:D-alanyl-lipoteichoic acid acyltransferase DltB (MBOAT superfamily)